MRLCIEEIVVVFKHHPTVIIDSMVVLIEVCSKVVGLFQHLVPLGILTVKVEVNVSARAVLWFGIQEAEPIPFDHHHIHSIGGKKLCKFLQYNALTLISLLDFLHIQCPIQPQSLVHRQILHSIP